MANCIEHSRPVYLRRPSLFSYIAQMFALRRLPISLCFPRSAIF